MNRPGDLIKGMDGTSTGRVVVEQLKHMRECLRTGKKHENDLDHFLNFKETQDGGQLTYNIIKEKMAEVLVHIKNKITNSKNTKGINEIKGK